MCENRCQANMAHIRHSRPDSGLGFQVRVLKIIQIVPYSLGKGPSWVRCLPPSRTNQHATLLPSKEGTPSRFQGLLPQSQGQSLASTVICVPYSPGSGWTMLSICGPGMDTTRDVGGPQPPGAAGAEGAGRGCARGRFRGLLRQLLNEIRAVSHALALSLVM